MRMAIRKHRRDFVAVIVLFVISLGVGGYILATSASTCPWVPVLGTDFVTLQGRVHRPPSRSRRARARPSTSPACRSARSPRSTYGRPRAW